MYVKIIKCSSKNYWYNIYVGHVFEVEDRKDKSYSCVCDCYIGYSISKQDCEIIDFDEGKISEEIIRNMLFFLNEFEKEKIDEYINIWKICGYIKQSREEKIKEKLKELEKELISLYEEKLKNL